MIDPHDPKSGGEVLGQRHARVADGLLRSLFAVASSTTGSKGRVALAAVGSYGRGGVALKSDLDVRFLAASKKEDAVPIAEAMLYPLWDAGLSIGHQVVTASELMDLAKTDLPTATSLLDWRHLAGDEALSQDLMHRARTRLFADGSVGAFVQRLSEEVIGRHDRFGGSVYLLEPDVKNGAGGLRDLDVSWWAGTARWGIDDVADLVRLGVIVGREAKAMAKAREFLWQIRNRLHLAAGRRADRLTFDLQEKLCIELGYGEGGAAVEAFMSEYYRNARAISHVREIVFNRAKPHASRRKPHDEDIGRGLRLFDGHVTIGDIGDLATDPAIAFRLFAEAVTRRAPVFPFAREAVARAAQDPQFCEALRSSREAAQLFVHLTATAQETIFSRRSVLGELHEVGLLVAMLPEFSPVIGRVHHDIYHVYTVDVHSVAAVDRLRELVRGDLAREHPLACRLAAEISRPVVLYLATLLHDVGKAIGGKDHANRGAEMAKGIGARLGLSPEDTDAIVHLVRHHLLMYHVATRRDLDDPAAIEDFVKDVRGRENLRELYLLTVADLSTTSPTAMTSWKAKLLDELYLSADRWLAGRVSGGLDDERIARVREAALWLTGDTPLARAFLASMPDRYLLSNSPQAIASHIEVATRAAPDTAAVAIRATDHPDLSELCVVAPDRPGLLASIAAAISASRLEVNAAQIHSHALPDGRGQAVDLFWVRGPGADPRQVPHTLRHLERDLSALIRGETTPQSIVESRGRSQWASRPTPKVETEVFLDGRASPTHGIIEVFTRDRAGLLYTLAQTLHELGLSISLAKINTEGSRVADVFYVTDRDGSKVDVVSRADDIRGRILGALDALHQRQGESG
jgi:[protein-PII] uridylyltransferase